MINFKGDINFLFACRNNAASRFAYKVYNIVDEVDSVLIDDARTPLIISGPVSARVTSLLRRLLRCVKNKLTAAVTRSIHSFALRLRPVVGWIRKNSQVLLCSWHLRLPTQ